MNTTMKNKQKDTIEIETAATLAGLFAIIFFAYQVFAATPHAGSHKIKKVIDGDTVKLENGKTVRLAGINTPEMNYKPDDPNTNAKPECYAIRARKALKRVTNSSTQIFISPKPIGKHGRYIGYLQGEDKMQINRWLVLQGYAEAYWTDQFVQEEKKALLNNRGLHSECK